MNRILIALFTVLTLPALALADKPLKITQLAESVYLHTSYKQFEGYGLVDSNGLVVIDDNQAYIIDTPWSEEATVSLLTWISDQGYTAAASVSTHSHDDRTAGIELLNSKSIPTYTSELTHSLLILQQKPVPTHTFKGDHYSLGNGLIELFYPGAGHTADNIVAWLPQSKILFGGCIIKSHETKNLGFVGDASIDDWAQSIDRIKLKNFAIEIVVPGHGAVGHSDLLDHSITLVESAK